MCLGRKNMALPRSFTALYDLCKMWSGFGFIPLRKLIPGSQRHVLWYILILSLLHFASGLFRILSGWEEIWHCPLLIKANEHANPYFCLVLKEVREIWSIGGRNLLQLLSLGRFLPSWTRSYKGTSNIWNLFGFNSEESTITHLNDVY